MTPDLELSPALEALDPQHRQHLLDAIATAHRRQDEELVRAIDDGLNIVPRVLRGAVRKALFG